MPNHSSYFYCTLCAPLSKATHIRSDKLNQHLGVHPGCGKDIFSKKDSDKPQPTPKFAIVKPEISKITQPKARIFDVQPPQSSPLPISTGNYVGNLIESVFDGSKFQTEAAGATCSDSHAFSLEDPSLDISSFFITSTNHTSNDISNQTTNLPTPLSPPRNKLLAHKRCRTLVDNEETKEENVQPSSKRLKTNPPLLFEVTKFNPLPPQPMSVNDCLFQGPQMAQLTRQTSSLVAGEVVGLLTSNQPLPKYTKHQIKQQQLNAAITAQVANITQPSYLSEVQKQSYTISEFISPQGFGTAAANIAEKVAAKVYKDHPHLIPDISSVDLGGRPLTSDEQTQLKNLDSLLDPFYSDGFVVGQLYRNTSTLEQRNEDKKHIKERWIAVDKGQNPMDEIQPKPCFNFKYSRPDSALVPPKNKSAPVPKIRIPLDDYIASEFFFDLINDSADDISTFQVCARRLRFTKNIPIDKFLELLAQLMNDLGPYYFIVSMDMTADMGVGFSPEVLRAYFQSLNAATSLAGRFCIKTPVDGFGDGVELTIYNKLYGCVMLGSFAVGSSVNSSLGNWYDNPNLQLTSNITKSLKAGYTRFEVRFYHSELSSARYYSNILKRSIQHFVKSNAALIQPIADQWSALTSCLNGSLIVTESSMQCATLIACIDVGNGQVRLSGHSYQRNSMTPPGRSMEEFARMIACNNSPNGRVSILNTCIEGDLIFLDPIQTWLKPYKSTQFWFDRGFCPNKHSVRAVQPVDMGLIPTRAVKLELLTKSIRFGSGFDETLLKEVRAPYHLPFSLVVPKAPKLISKPNPKTFKDILCLTVASLSEQSGRLTVVAKVVISKAKSLFLTSISKDSQVFPLSKLFVSRCLREVIDEGRLVYCAYNGRLKLPG